MATTSLKLPDSLKDRVSNLVSNTDKTAHAFMLEAIAEKAAREEQERAFMARAEASLQHYRETGISYAAEDVHAYVRAKLNGQPLPDLIPVKDKGHL